MRPSKPRTLPPRSAPKRSKLALLGGSGSGNKTKEKASKADFSDVVRRVGGAPSTGRGEFETHVDQNEDPELGEIVVVIKKKSRLGSNSMQWGALGETTNIPAAAVAKEQRAPVSDGFLKAPEGDENQK